MASANQVNALLAPFAEAIEETPWEVGIVASALRWQLKRVLLNRSITGLPMLCPHVEDDGAISVEWITRHVRLGIHVAVDPAESSWHVVGDDAAGHVLKSGALAGCDLVAVVDIFLALVTCVSQYNDGREK